ncbi:DUF1398 domain-containing protein [Streptococcus uberis]|uniref:DUF1398 family protein n=1 Tax=Streptococcus uberis TaxID=1349 RepID=UPI000543D44D|nr:DUF1398 family protein [Streptococcus uberis]KHD40947.1 hypothetical protein NA32_01535 [Streptococcus hongkongensis]MCR4257291.1 DUF1398 domain-containing protein [Streptococcus uberis]SQG46385.1 Phage envelope protein [Streptococcus uberis]
MLRDDIIAAQERFSGNDFPSLVKAYIALGIVTYAINIQTGQAAYVTKNGQKCDLPAYQVENVKSKSDPSQFLEKLRNHQAKETDIPTFCQDCATNGVCRWVVDLVTKTCRYFDLEDKVVYTETIPL